MKFLLTYFFLLFLLQPIHAQKNITLRIDPDNSVGGTISQYFDEVTFIPLETNNTSLFGDIHKLLVTQKGGFVFSDDDTHSFYSFDKNGHFLVRIDQNTHPPITSWTSFPALAYNRERDEIVMYNPNANKKGLLYLDENGLIKGHTGYNGLIYSMDRLDVNTTLTVDFPMGNGDSTIYLVNMYKDSVHYLKYFPVKLKGIHVGDGRGYEFYHSDTNSFFSEGKKDLVFHVFDTEGLEKSYKIVLPDAYSYPLDFDSLKGAKRDAAINGRMKLVSRVQNIFEYRDWLFFETMTGSGYFVGNRHLMYNLKDERLICLDRISSDNLSCFMPFYSEFGTITAVAGDYIYCYVPAYQLFDVKNEDTHFLWKKIPVLKHFFETGNRKSNPIIVRLKLKDNL